MSRTRKIILAVAGALVLAAGAAGAVALSMTSGLVAAADGFFLAVKEQGPQGARTFLSRDFLASTGEEELAAWVDGSGLARFVEARWTSRLVALGGGRGELGGTIELEDGRTVPVQLTLVHEEGAWKIYALSKPARDPSEPRVSDRLPGSEELLALVRGNVHALGVSRNGGDFTPFWNGMSRLWQAGTTLEQIGGAFGQLEGDYTELDPYTPTIVGAPAVQDGVLTVQVRYDVESGPVFVRGRYVHERAGWRLIAFYVGGAQKDG